VVHTFQWHGALQNLHDNIEKYLDDHSPIADSPQHQGQPDIQQDPQAAPLQQDADSSTGICDPPRGHAPEVAAQDVSGIEQAAGEWASLALGQEVPNGCLRDQRHSLATDADTAALAAEAAALAASEHAVSSQEDETSAPTVAEAVFGAEEVGDASEIGEEEALSALILRESDATLEASTNVQAPVGGAPSAGLAGTGSEPVGGVMLSVQGDGVHNAAAETVEADALPCPSGLDTVPDDGGTLAGGRFEAAHGQPPAASTSQGDLNGGSDLDVASSTEGHLTVADVSSALGNGHVPGLHASHDVVGQPTTGKRAGDASRHGGTAGSAQPVAEGRAFGSVHSDNDLYPLQSPWGLQQMQPRLQDRSARREAGSCKISAAVGEGVDAGEGDTCVLPSAAQAEVMRSIDEGMEQGSLASAALKAPNGSMSSGIDLEQSVVEAYVSVRVAHISERRQSTTLSMLVLHDLETSPHNDSTHALPLDLGVPHSPCMTCTTLGRRPLQDSCG
jgi:hypothetical protein